VVKTT